MVVSSGDRLQKYLASLGVSSRRKIEDWISQGKITVDGKVAQLGDRVTPTSQIKIDGRPIKTQPGKSDPKYPRGKNQQRVILYNKPEGEICTRSDPKKRPTVFRNLPIIKGGRWVAVGRLDINTRGMMLFTNDGELANHLMHPKLEIEREYLCRVYGQVDDDSMERLKQGIKIDDQVIRFHSIRRQQGERSNAWYSVVVKEGKYREVRRLWEAIGCQLSRLSRIRYGKVALPRGIKLGDWIELTPETIERLAKNADKDKVITPRLGKKSSRRQNRSNSRR